MKIGIQHITLVIQIGVIVLLVILLRGGNTKALDAKVDAKDEVIEMIREQRDQERARADQAMENWRRADSALQAQDKTTIIRYEKIPARINAISNKDSLRAAGRSAVERYNLH